MGLLKPMGQGQGWLKAGFLGFPKSGKTYTATLLALATRTFLDLKGPIAFFDTEGGAEYVAELVKKQTGLDMIGVRSRSFGDLVTTGREAEKEGVSVLIADSMTHVWRELCEAHLKQINEGRKRKGLSTRYRLEFQDWGIIKNKWAEWTDLYLNSKLHIIIAGRAGFEYDFEENEETGKKDLVKTGIKMKTEGEFGFEPSLLVEMERVQSMKDKTEILHRATVIGDRFSAIDGAQMDFVGIDDKDPKKVEKEIKSVFDFFGRHVRRLTPGAHAPIDTEIKTDLGVDTEGDTQWHRDKRERTILCEEIQGELVKKWPGQTAVEKKAKADAMEEHFKTRSWTKIETLISLPVLREGLLKLKGLSAPPEDQEQEARASALKQIQTAIEEQKWKPEELASYLEKNFSGKPLEELSLDALNQMREEVEVAF